VRDDIGLSYRGMPLVEEWRNREQEGVIVVAVKAEQLKDACKTNHKHVITPSKRRVWPTTAQQALQTLTTATGTGTASHKSTLK
jgi:hypothetical protein